MELLKQIIRRFKRDSVRSSINLIGLALGLSITFIITYYVKNELSYENSFRNSDHIYRLTRKDADGTHWAAIPPTIGLMVKAEVPEIEEVTRLMLCKEQIISLGEKSFRETDGCYADNSFFSIFIVQWISGNSKTALSGPSSVVLSKSLAGKIFGDEDPVGRILTIDGENKMSVTGVVNDLPDNTHLKFNYFISMPEPYSDLAAYGGWNNFYTYCLLKPSAEDSMVDNKLSRFISNYMKELSGQASGSGQTSLVLQPIRKIHLFSKLEKEISGNNDATSIIIFSLVALLVLFVSCANYINLTVIMAFKRVHEIGIKKVFGVRKINLIIHFLSESFIHVLISALLAIELIYLFQTKYGSLFDLNIEFSHSDVLVSVAMILGVTFLASFYPAMIISKYSINDSLKSKKNIDTRFRKSLVVFQFAVSIFLIICTIGIHSQMRYIQNKNLGFNKDATISVQLYGDLYNQFRDRGDALKNDLLKHPGISALSLTSYELGKRIGYVPVIPESIPDPENLPDVRVLNTDGRLISLLNVKIVDGNDFPEDSKVSSVILNEAAVKALGFKSPLNEWVSIGNSKCKVVGVIRDFNFSSLHNKVEPLAITNIPYFLNKMYVKINSADLLSSLAYIEDIIHKMAPGYMFSYSFLDQTISKQYMAEQKMNTLFNIFTMLAVFIACLGLAVLSIYSAELRTKEIGIRKVNGARTAELLVLLYKEYIIAIITAFIIAGFLSWFMINKWLENFAYHTTIKMWFFALALGIIMVFAFISLSWQVWKTARRNPVESLRYE